MKTGEVQVLDSVDATLALGRAVAAELQAGDVLALDGQLGSGKTHFVKGLAEGMGVRGDVTSPTFALVQEYRGGRLPVFHFDFYRLENAEELIHLGWDEYLDEEGVMVVEWAGKFPELLPGNAQWWQFEIRDDGSRSAWRKNNPGRDEEGKA